jgi:two-component system, response regulator
MADWITFREAPSLQSMELPLDILVVDDNSTDLLFFGRAARNTHLNIRLQTLSAGQQAIDYLSAKGEYGDRSKYPWPDLIILDLKMPEINGFDFLAWRKASALFSSIPVIILSGSSEPSDIKRIFELGADNHIVKPAGLDEWEKVVRDVWEFGKQNTPLTRPKESEPR